MTGLFVIAWRDCEYFYSLIMHPCMWLSLTHVWRLGLETGLGLHVTFLGLNNDCGGLCNWSSKNWVPHFNHQQGILGTPADFWYNFCNSPEHHISACLHHPSFPFAAYHAFSLGAANDPTLYFDTGATHYTTNDGATLQDPSPYIGNASVLIGTGCLFLLLTLTLFLLS